MILKKDFGLVILKVLSFLEDPPNFHLYLISMHAPKYNLFPI